MTAVQELDRTLFEGYIKPKSNIATAILCGGILDTNMDWYETPQPTGKFSLIVIQVIELNLNRNTAIYV
jgi:hypothetical protein